MVVEQFKTFVLEINIYFFYLIILLTKGKYSVNITYWGERKKANSVREEAFWGEVKPS